MTTSVTTFDNADESLVPAEWPATPADRPAVRPRQLGAAVLLLMVGLWFFPGTVAPHMAAARLRHALAAHLFALIFGVGMIVWAVEFPFLNPAVGQPDLEATHTTPVTMTWWELLRGPPAALAAVTYDHAGRAGMAAPIGWLIGLEAALLAVAVAAMPFGAVGESAGTVFGRSVRLTYWSTTLILPVGLAVLLEPQVREAFGLTMQWLPAHTIGVAACALWWLWVLLRSGWDCGGAPKVGAGRPRVPRCEGCGYTIAFLPLSTQCPECGQAVAASLPQERTEPAVARAEGFWPWLRGFFATLRHALGDRSFFRALAVYRCQERARSFIIALCAIDAALILPGIPGAYSAVVGSTLESELWAGALAIATVGFCGQVLLAGLMASIVSAVAKRPLLPTSVATFYGLSSLLPLTAGALIGTVTYLVVELVINVGSARALLPGVIVMSAIAVSAWFWVGIRAVRCFVRAVRDTQYANA